MFSFFANIFGWILNFFYEFFQNYGIAIIVFSVCIKLILFPISIKQQKTMKKSAKVQAKMKELQNKYSNNQEKLNQEIMELYKSEKMNPFSGCLSSIVQIILLLSVFYLVRSPLTYMKKIDTAVIDEYKTQISEESKNSAYPEIAIIQQFGSQDETVNINMNLLGLDLSAIPSSDFTNYKALIIPALYVLTTFISMKLTSNMQNPNKKKEDNNGEKTEKDEMDAVLQANKSMTLMMPIMSIMIAVVAPLGLALYWLTNNILMIIERLIINKFFSNMGEED